MPTEFPLGRKLTPFGLLSDPKIPVRIHTSAGPRTYRFLIDTGADCSLAPRRLAEEVGLGWDALVPVHIAGVERRGVTARVGSLPIVIAGVALTIRCVFLDRPGAPFILGRADFLDRFVLTVDTARGTITLSDVP